MDVKKKYFIKHGTNQSRIHIDHIKYQVDVNTMEHSSTSSLQLNEIGRVVFTSAKELFFDPYFKNKACGAFILIDPITNNTSAVGMIIGEVSDKEIHSVDDRATLDLKKLDIDVAHYESVLKVVKELERQGLGIKVIK